MTKRIVSAAVCILLLANCAMAESAMGIPLFDQVAVEQEAAAVEAVNNEKSGTMLGEDLITSMRNGVYCVPGSDVERASVTEIRFINNVDEPADDAWDMSAAKDGSVLAWMADSALVIGSEGCVKAPESCYYLFALYRNLERISFSGNFDTSEVTNMAGMFAGCEKLREIDMETLDVSKVTTMESMFEGDSALEKIHATSWQLTSLENSDNIFNGCNKLGFDTIDGIMIEKIEAMEAVAAEKYPPLKVGDRGDGVAALQKKLMELGYNSITKSDGIFGARTARAVHAFKADHGIFDGKKHTEDDCVASGLMQEALYSAEIADQSKNDEKTEESEAVTAPTDIALVIPADGEIKSKELSNNQLRLNFTLKNNSADRTISAYTLILRATDAWGNDLYEEPITTDIAQTIKPGETAKSGNVTVDGRGKLANIEVGVQSVTYDDGTVEEAPEIEYVTFPAVNWL